MDKFEVGCKIVLTRYLGTVKGLENGAIGKVAMHTELDIILVDFDDPKFQGIPVYPAEMELAPADSMAAAPIADDPFAAPNEVHTTPYEALAFHVQCAVVAAMPEDTWRKGWTPGQAVNEMASLLDEQARKIATLQAELAQARRILEPMRETLGRFLRQEKYLDFLEYMSAVCDSDGVMHNFEAAGDWLIAHELKQAAQGAPKAD